MDDAPYITLRIGGGGGGGGVTMCTYCPSKQCGLIPCRLFGGGETEPGIQSFLSNVDFQTMSAYNRCGHCDV